MKTRLLILFVLVGFLSLISTIQMIQSVPELTFDDAYDYSELVIVGQIESVEILSEPFIGENISRSGIALYDVAVLFSLKNPDKVTEITVPGEFLREPHGMSYDTYPYEAGQTVVLFIQSDDHVTGHDLVVRSGTSEVIHPAPEDGSGCEDHRYSDYNGYCMRTKIQNQDLPICDPNPKHDFGKCKREFQEPDNTLQHVLDHCNATGAVNDDERRWWNTTHYIDNVDCEFLDKVIGSPTYGLPLEDNESESEPLIMSDGQQHMIEEYCETGMRHLDMIGIPQCIKNEPICGPNSKLSDGICVAIDGGCKPDIHGNTTWCDPQYDYLKIILSEPSAFIFVFGTPVLIAGIIIFIVWRKRK
ncbi:hypothetical protein K0U27_01870 [archaeon]|nr:hypothetical protein [archaeon]